MAYCSLYASIGMVSLISSLTALGMPYFIPHSERLIVVVASAPHIGLLLIGCSPQTSLATFNVTGLVTPRSVSSPSRATTRSPSKVKLVDLKVMVGYLATLKKSSLLACVSSLGSIVLIEVVSIEI